MAFFWDLLSRLFQAERGEGEASDGRWQIDPDG